MPSNEQQYWKNPCIYRVPAFITNLNPEDYQPRVVSFGPYHNSDNHLRPMEEHKHRACCRFFQRSGKSLELFLDSLRNVEDKLEDSYNALCPKWEEGMGDQFLMLMIMDGCFMLEVMRAAMINEPSDPIFGTHRYIMPYIRRDMLMLENQLPMLVLYQLVAVYDGKEADECIECVNQLILWFYSIKTGKTRMGRCLHVLDVFRKGLLMESEKDQHEQENVGREGISRSKPKEIELIVPFATLLNKLKNGEPEAGEDYKNSRDTSIMGMGHVVDVFTKCLPKKTEEGQHKIIRSATELNEAGIRFKTSKTSSLKDISFAGGKLKLPVIMVDDAFKSNFLNVMTFERLHIGAGTGVTSYVIFMDNIINDKQDVALLHTEGIIQNSIGSNEAVAELFNLLCKEVTLVSNNSLESVQKEISKHCNKRWNMWRAYFNRTYFKNPWTILSLIAAIFLFALTIIQTVYALLVYY
ncbi:hypothetical protein BT93_L0188 [Corymbia citriodora subsp. variegata]|uniref:Uncharacterized protein n=1 Tax=Corymbia citriodora subsp. variegata TaxID=360336 RepID=A0A8T0CSW7_CORYI|nr:hypothetical protein BT93_L0188 [Corymbia citriodora subsp. variegata]